MWAGSLSPEMVSGLAGVALALVFRYVPGVKQKWNALDGDEKQMYMGMLVLIVGMGIFIASCGGWVGWIECSKAGLRELVVCVLYTLMGNQSVYPLVKEQEKHE